MAQSTFADAINASEPVAVFRASLAAFEADRRALDGHLARSGQIRFTTRYRLGTGGAAVAAFSDILLDANLDAAVASVVSSAALAPLEQVPAEMTSLPQTEADFKSLADAHRKHLEDFEARTGRRWYEVLGEALRSTSVPFARLHACYQAFFFLLRAYQDRVYSVLLEVLGSDSGGPKVSISKVVDKKGTFKTNSPAGAFLANRCSSYGLWFARFKKIRDDLKFGASTSTSAMGLDLRIVISHPDESKQSNVGDTSDVCGLADAAEAFERSRELVREITHLAEQRSK